MLYYLSRADVEDRMAETATSEGARNVHREMADAYRSRAAFWRMTDSYTDIFPIEPVRPTQHAG